jgi:hypothetical protein
MKHLLPLALAALGFAAGWWLPHGADPASTASTAPTAEESSRREQRKRALLEFLLDEGELSLHRSRTAPLAGLLAMTEGEDCSPEDIRRMVTLDPVASMDELLTNPVASSWVAKEVAAEWAARQPDEALRYLRGKHGYRADDCLAAALVAAYPARPQLVGEVLRSKPRDWQAYHLKDLFKETRKVRKPGAPPISDDPFSDDGQWMLSRFGPDLLDCLADDELRELAKSYWEPAEEERKTTAPLPNIVTWDPSSYDPDSSGQRDLLRTDLRDKGNETIEKIVAHGNREARQEVMRSVIHNFPNDPKQWNEALEKLEATIEQLGVIPDQLPSHFEQGPFLRGPEVAAWIDRQPLALRRAWAPAFVETWAEVDPQPALEWAQALTENAARDQAFQTGLIVWTHQAPQAAVDHVEGLPPGDLREAAISNAAATWACIDPTAARKWVQGLPESPGKQRALERLKR